MHYSLLNKLKNNRIASIKQRLVINSDSVIKRLTESTGVKMA